MKPNGQKILVIGVGNEFRSDDGAGLSVADTVKQRKLKTVLVRNEREGGADLMDLWRGWETVFIIDAIRSGSEPGTVFRLNASERPIPSKFLQTSTHSFGAAQTIEMARVLQELPKEIIIYGIEGSYFDTGVGLSPRVEKGIEEASQKILEELKNEPKWFEGMRNAFTLQKNENLSVVLVVMHRDTCIENHKIPCPLTLEVLDGEIRLNTDAESVTVDDHELVTLLAGVSHSIESVKQSSILVTLGGSQDYL